MASPAAKNGGIIQGLWEASLGRPVVIKVTAGNVSDVKMADALLAEVSNCRYVLADKGYDSDRLRKLIRDKGAKTCNPGQKSPQEEDPL